MITIKPYYIVDFLPLRLRIFFKWGNLSMSLSCKVTFICTWISIIFKRVNLMPMSWIPMYTRKKKQIVYLEPNTDWKFYLNKTISLWWFASVRAIYFQNMLLSFWVGCCTSYTRWGCQSQNLRLWDLWFVFFGQLPVLHLFF